MRSIGRNGAREYCTPSLNNSSTIYQETLVRGQPWIAFAREKLWVATYCFFRARFNDASFIQKSGIFFILLMHNVEKVARFNYSATPGIIHLIIMEWNVRLHQILSRIICRNSGLISNRGKGQSGYTPSHIRSRRSRVALILADSIRHWYEKKRKKKEGKKKHKEKKKNRRIVFRLSSGVAFNPNSRIKVENRDKRDGRSRARPCVENPRIPRVCVPRAADSMHSLGNEYEFLTSPSK